jgi:hypothetical protein
LKSQQQQLQSQQQNLQTQMMSNQAQLPSTSQSSEQALHDLILKQQLMLE